MTQTTTDATSLDAAEEPTELSHLVVDAVADAEGVSALDLDPLAAVIDPEALDTLFAPGLRTDTEAPPGGEVRFTYYGYEVRVTGSGRVSLTDVEAEVDA